ncbi:hypothetical protein BRADI_4g02196v3 [Brachypodium distachyon]|uniref:Uncharacterized protein n=1 Tax=Brachypodium distachyon TaxID=15368 RepID=A0A2K2CJZ5_BRADI|nr:hypothetical protein BRADI_4g02196v3 [Brachypodium distachyon]
MVNAGGVGDGFARSIVSDESQRRRFKINCRMNILWAGLQKKAHREVARLGAQLASEKVLFSRQDGWRLIY